MDLRFAFLCDSARYRHGNLSASGIGRIGFDRITDSLTLCGQLIFELTDVGQHSVNVILENPDGEVIGSGSLTSEVERPAEEEVAYGTWAFIFDFNNLDFDRTGPHKVTVQLTKRPTHEILFEVY